MSDIVRPSPETLDTLPAQNLYLILLRKIRYLKFLAAKSGLQENLYNQ